MAADRRLPWPGAPVASGSAAITETDFLSPYIEAISVFADLKRIAATGQKYAIDCMYGAGEVYSRASSRAWR